MSVRNDRITRGKLGDIVFQLNPTEITHDDGAIWGEINSPGMLRPITSYNYGRAGTFSFELYFNKKYYKKVDLVSVRKKLNEYRVSKKSILFTYMGQTSKVVIQECSIRILGMDAKLNPTELTATITLKQIYD